MARQPGKFFYQPRALYRLPVRIFVCHVTQGAIKKNNKTGSDSSMTVPQGVYTRQSFCILHSYDTYQLPLYTFSSVREVTPEIHTLGSPGLTGHSWKFPKITLNSAFYPPSSGYNGLESFSNERKIDRIAAGKLARKAHSLISCYRHESV